MLSPFMHIAPNSNKELRVVDVPYHLHAYELTLWCLLMGTAYSSSFYKAFEWVAPLKVLMAPYPPTYKNTPCYYPFRPNSHYNDNYTTSAMGPQIKSFVIIVLLLFINSSGGAKGSKYDVNLANPLREVITHMNMRKILVVDMTLDYEKPGPNPKHDKGKP
ncbi:hypothetical protein L1049_023212 [Liquidambar formosana]|uniref:Uncharacterized protein n=1 Tax=Liquidambar formosana TaxID=63359 RepID=A0AAP0RFR6_LIQFO